jgi:ketopantoate hydroxymethyltransferase
VPDELAAEINRTVKIPVIGIGAGSATDGQVLVLHDMLGLSERAPVREEHGGQQHSTCHQRLRQSG